MSRQNDGYILITTLLLLLVLTIVGLTTIGTSTMGNTLSGNMRLRERNLARAEAGTEISARLIDQSLTNDDTIGFEAVIKDASLPSELKSVFFSRDNTDTTDDDTDTTDVGFSVDTDFVSVDIDLMIVANLPGGSLIVNSEYDSHHGGGGGGLASYQRVNATGSGLARSAAEIGTIYRYVPK